MRVLVTGDEGYVGSHVALHLENAGHQVVGFDRARGQELGDFDGLVAAAAGCEAVAHAAALAHDSAGTASEIMSVNVGATWNALAAAEAVATRIFVYFSSAQVFGIAEGEQLPDYLPIDDRHPRKATRPYGLSKRFAEDLCEAATRRTGITTVALRPVAVWTPSIYERIWRAHRAERSYEWSPIWEFGAFIDIRDVATAVEATLQVPQGQHARLILCSSDISASKPTVAMVEQLIPSVPWQAHARAGFESEPWRALFDTSAARETLCWTPIHTWAQWVCSEKRGADE